jgi:hypothetical protein
MTKSAAEVFKDVMALSAAEREELARLLAMQSDSDWVSPQIEQAWLAEARRRDKAVDDGTEALIPAEEAMRELRKRYGG